MKKELGILLLLVELCAIVSCINPRFLSELNLQNTARLVSMFGIFSIGAGLVIITGGIDLSVGSMLAFQGVILAMMLRQWGWSWQVAAPTVVAGCMVLGAIHGLLITRFRMQAFIVTLCGLLIYRGLARFVADDTTKGFGQESYGILTFLQEGMIPVWLIVPIILVALVLYIGFAKAQSPKRIAQGTGFLLGLQLIVCLLISPLTFLYNAEKSFPQALGSYFTSLPQSFTQTFPTAFFAWTIVFIILYALIAAVRAAALSRIKHIPVRILSHVVLLAAALGLCCLGFSLIFRQTEPFYRIRIPWLDASMIFGHMAPLHKIQVPMSFILLLGVALIMWIVLHRSVYGRYLLAVGRNEEAARFSGIKTNLVTASAYILAAGLTGISGVLFAFYTNMVTPSTHGTFYELYGIAAAVLGGCSLRGGEGSIIGILIGAALIQVLQNFVNLMEIPSSLNFAVMGTVILFGVLADQVIAYRRAKSVRLK